MKRSDIKKIKESLKNYFLFEKAPGIIVVSLDKSELPFAYLVDTEEGLLISFAVDFIACSIATNVALEVNKIKEVVLAENFYISNAGNTHWGEEAERLFNMDNLIDLENIQAASEELN